jgi:hypothetical protein
MMVIEILVLKDGKQRVAGALDVGLDGRLRVMPASSADSAMMGRIAKDRLVIKGRVLTADTDLPAWLATLPTVYDGTYLRARAK